VYLGSLSGASWLGRRPGRLGGGATLITTLLAATACIGESRTEPVATGASTSVSSSIAPPGGFAAKADESQFRVVLTWLPPETDVDSFMILRDGFQRERVPGSATSYVDEQIEPGRWYVYEIESEEGEGRSARAEASVIVERPPVEEARLGGPFVLELRATDFSGYEEFGRSESRDVVVMRPRCERGVCAVDWRLRTAGTSGTLRFHGDSYRGSSESTSRVRCGDRALTSRVSLTLEVTDASFLDHEWRATAFTGTLREVTPAQFDCVAARATFEVTGDYAPSAAETATEPEIDT
jgi:hypothetical protein